MRKVRLFAVIVALGCAAWSSAPGLAAQNLDGIWVTNSASNTVNHIDRNGSVIKTYTVPAGRPVGVTVVANGDAWFAIQNLGLIYGIDVSGNAIGSFAVGGRPTGMGADLNGNVWCGNLTGGFGKFDLNSRTVTTVTMPGGASSQNIATDSRGNVWLGDSGRIWKVAPDGTVLFTLLESGHRTPVVDHNDVVFSTGFNSTTLVKWSNNGARLGTYPLTVSSQQGLAVDGDGNLWLGSQSANVLKFSPGGQLLGTFPTGATSLIAVAVDGMNDIWVSNFNTTTVTKMKTDGTVLQTIPVGSSPIPIGDATGFQRAVFSDPFGDVDGDKHRNNAEAVAGFNPFDATSVPCSLTIGGTRRIGGTATLAYVDNGNRGPGAAYAMACSFTPGVIPIGLKRRIDVGLDNLFLASFQLPAVFKDFQGILDTSGRATGTLVIPNLPALVKQTVYCVAVSIDAQAPQGIRAITPAGSFVVQP